MSVLGKTIQSLFKNKETLKSPVFIKDFEKENEQLRDLVELSTWVIGEKKETIERDILLLKHGQVGEHNVYYELKNAFIPMLCLHDIRIEFMDYVAQFDFIVITKKFICILETKTLSGDIDITEDGDFIRLVKSSSGKIYKKEGMYSPVSQNDRHKKILQQLLTTNRLLKDEPIMSSVIMANPKSIINKSKAPKYIQKHIHKYDQLTTILSEAMNQQSTITCFPEEQMFNIAHFLLANHKPIKYDLINKYNLKEGIDFQTRQTEVFIKPSNITTESTKYNKSASLSKALKKYRTDTAKSEELRPYWIFNNEELSALVEHKPKDLTELSKINGFGPKRIEKHGNAIIAIINKHQ